MSEDWEVQTYLDDKCKKEEENVRTAQTSFLCIVKATKRWHDKL